MHPCVAKWQYMKLIPNILKKTTFSLLILALVSIWVNPALDILLGFLLQPLGISLSSYLISYWTIVLPDKYSAGGVFSDDNPMPLNVHHHSYVKTHLSDMPLSAHKKTTKLCCHVQIHTDTHIAIFNQGVGRPSFLSGQDLSCTQWFLSTPALVTTLQECSPSKFHSHLFDWGLRAIDWEPIMSACLLS